MLIGQFKFPPCPPYARWGLLHRIASNYGGNTASQWKNWTLIYSLFCLKSLLPEIKLFKMIADICSGLPIPVCISKTDIIIADLLFVKFGESFELLYGKKYVTPNMRLHCNLKECVIDCGPVHAFLCFSFEHFNGILRATQVNKRSV